MINNKIKVFTDMTTWQEAHKLVIEIYLTTKSFPGDEIFGIVTQLRRAVISITSNIAEGFSRKTYKEKTQFYYVALGSLTEVQNQIIAARDVGYLTNAKYKKLEEQCIVVAKLLNALISKSKTFYIPNSRF